MTPWDLVELLGSAPRSVDIMLEAKAKDLAVLWLRDQLARVAPDVAALEERLSQARRPSTVPKIA